MARGRRTTRVSGAVGVLAALGGVWLPLSAFAQNEAELDSPAAPDDPASAMYRLEDVYNRLNTGAAGAKRAGAFTPPGDGPGAGKTGKTLDQVMGVAPAKSGNAASADDVLAGKDYWGLKDGEWGNQVGTMINRGAVTLTPSTTNQTIQAGYHNGSGTVAGDANLAAGNIRNGVDLFGVTGTYVGTDTSSGDAVAGDILDGRKAWVDGAELTGTMINRGAVALTPGTDSQTIPGGYHNGSGTVAGDANLAAGNIKDGVEVFGVTGTYVGTDTSSGDAAAADIALGKKAWVDGQEVTGTLAGGVACTGTFSPGGRWCDNGDGTVTDATTGLVWLKAADWGGRQYMHDDGPIYGYAFRRVAEAEEVAPIGDYQHWRLPTMTELLGLATGTEAVSSAQPRLFTDVKSDWYWSSTIVGQSFEAVYLPDGSWDPVSGPAYVWPVCGGL